LGGGGGVRAAGAPGLEPRCGGPDLRLRQPGRDGSATRQLATQAAGGNAKVVLAPGMAVKVSVQGAAPGADADAYHRDIASRQNQHLQSLGFKTAEVTVVATLTEAGGDVVWTQKNNSQTPIVATVNTAESFQAALDKVVWSMASGWAGAVAPAPVLIRTGAGVEALPRSVVLTGDH
jgi:hypothetical protein